MTWPGSSSAPGFARALLGIGALCLAAVLTGCVVQDLDEDGFAAPEDCNDTDPLHNPDTIEVCDGVDNNCDGRVDEGLLTTVFIDQDGDGFGVEGNTVDVCTPGAGHAMQDGDCDDADPARYPWAPEICDDVDDDCDGRLAAPDGAFWHTEAGTVKLEGLEGSKTERASLVLDEPGTLEMCGGVYYLDMVIDSDDVVVTSRFDVYWPLFVGGPTNANIEVRAPGVTTRLEQLRFTGGTGGLPRADGQRVGSAIVCASAGTQVRLHDIAVVGGDDVSAGRIAALGGCSMEFDGLSAQANPDSALYFEGGVHVISDAEFGTPLEVPGRGGTFVGGADVTLRGATFDNLRAESGAAFVAVDSHVRLGPLGETPSRIINTRSRDAAVVLDRSTFEGEAVDMGTPGIRSSDTDNQPVDIWVLDVDATYQLRRDATFRCDAGGCVER